MEERFVKITLTLDDLSAKVYGKVLESIKGGQNVEAANRCIFELGLGRSLLKINEKLAKEGEHNREEIEKILTLFEQWTESRKERIL